MSGPFTTAAKVNDTETREERRNGAVQVQGNAQREGGKEGGIQAAKKTHDLTDKCTSLLLKKSLK